MKKGLILGLVAVFVFLVVQLPVSGVRALLDGCMAAGTRWQSGGVRKCCECEQIAYMIFCDCDLDCPNNEPPSGSLGGEKTPPSQTAQDGEDTPDGATTVPDGYYPTTY